MEGTEVKQDEVPKDRSVADMLADSDDFPLNACGLNPNDPAFKECEACQ
jgi:hypothetical protein